MNRCFPSPNTTLAMEEAIATIMAMRHQEDTGYLSRDFLHQPHIINLALDVDSDCRKKMCQWSYQVVDFCKFNRESVEISLNLLDRYLLTPAGVRALQDRSIFQLAAMTALYTAVKIHEPEAMDPKLVSSLSRGTYSPDDVEKMEQILLKSLNWRVNPPTALSFVRQFLDLIPAEAMKAEERKIAYDITKLQTEVAVSEYSFVNVKASVTAYCSLMNALEEILEPGVFKYVSVMLQEAAGIRTSDQQVMEVQKFLYSGVVRQSKNQNAVEKHSPETLATVKPYQVFYEYSPRTTAQI